MPIKLYFIALTVFFTIDLIWLGLIARNFYQKHLGYLMSPQVNWTAAIIFYLIFIAGIIVFVVYPAYPQAPLTEIILKGALFGFVTYATYDLTNQATIKNWPYIVTIVDLLWGTTLSSLVSSLTYIIAKKLGI